MNGLNQRVQGVKTDDFDTKNHGFIFELFLEQQKTAETQQLSISTAPGWFKLAV